MHWAYFVAFGVAWLLLALLVGMVIGRAFRLGEGQYIVDDEDDWGPAA